MNAKGFMTAVAYGAAATIGAITANFAVRYGVRILTDPYERARKKQQLKRIKNKIIRKQKTES